MDMGMVGTGIYLTPRGLGLCIRSFLNARNHEKGLHNRQRTAINKEQQKNIAALRTQLEAQLKRSTEKEGDTLQDQLAGFLVQWKRKPEFAKFSLLEATQALLGSVKGTKVQPNTKNRALLVCFAAAADRVRGGGGADGVLERSYRVGSQDVAKVIQDAVRVQQRTEVQEEVQFLWALETAVTEYFEVPDTSDPMSHDI
jgi:hypothetical protein